MKTYFNTILIALAVVIASIIFANAITNRNRSNNTISVTGLGSKNFVSDLIVWEGSFAQKSMDLKAASAQLDQDRETIRKYLLSKGLTSDNLVFSAVNIERQFDTEKERTETRQGLFSRVMN